MNELREQSMIDAGLLVTGDLIFSTKIVGTARQLGRHVEVVNSSAAAIERIRSQLPACVLLDLSLRDLTEQSIGEIVNAAGGVPVLAFGSHVDVARLDAARSAGCAEVMPRSRLAATLPDLLTEHLKPSAPPGDKA